MLIGTYQSTLFTHGGYTATYHAPMLARRKIVMTQRGRMTKGALPLDLYYDTLVMKMESHYAKLYGSIPEQGRVTTTFKWSDHRRAHERKKERDPH
jgi:hypothetical protein